MLYILTLGRLYRLDPDLGNIEELSDNSGPRWGQISAVCLRHELGCNWRCCVADSGSICYFEVRDE
jgi:hypothetical protein